MARNKADHDTLLMALYGYEQKRSEIEEKIRELKTQLGNVKISPRANGTSPTKQPSVKRVLSADARKRIANAQKRRWAAHRKSKLQNSQSA
jgi:hypothetical protein